MYLKNLTVFGFKSFADKTALNFQPGVTAIVGPNGCGKSNVSDAIRWVLGEQSAKALRGGEMADVIFNGTDGRKPMGMGEVSLTLGGVGEESLRAAGVEVAYDEVTLTRRIFRDGGSEYFLNRTPCRLKDIQQLFMGTGVGRTSYSILAQGHITQILSSKPEDRRMIFEEAAGITKFKSQKKESLRKLEYTEQNLLRIADTIKEVKRQIGSLQRQAGKARRYKQISQELQHLDTQLARHQFDVLQAEITEKNAAVEKLRNEIEQGSNDVLRFENEIAQLRERLSELEHEVAAQQQRGLELKGEIERHESRIHFNEERLREIESQNSKALAEIAQAEERCRAAQEELATITEKLSAAGDRADAAQGSVADQAERAAAKSRTACANGRRHCARRSPPRLPPRRICRASATKSPRWICRSRAIPSASKNFPPKKCSLKKSARGLKRACRNSPRASRLEKLNVATTRGSVEQRQNRLRELQTELQNSSAEQDKFLQQQAEKRSRLHVLEQLEGSREGFDAGAVAALRQSRSVIGSLADRIRVPEQFVVAVENALGHQPATRPDRAAGIRAGNSRRLEREQDPAARASPRWPSSNIRMKSNLRLTANCRRTQTARRTERIAARPDCPRDERDSGRAAGGTAVEIAAGPHVHRVRFAARPRRKSRTATRAAISSRSRGDLLNRHGIYTGGYLNGHGNRQGARLDSRPQKSDHRIAGGIDRIAEAASRKPAASAARC